MNNYWVRSLSFTLSYFFWIWKPLQWKNWIEKSWIEFEIKKMCVRFRGSIPFTRMTWFMDIKSLEFYAFQKFDKFSDCVQNFHILVLKSFVMCMCFLILRSILFQNISTFFVQGIDPFRFTFVISYVSLIFLWSQSPLWIQNLS